MARNEAFNQGRKGNVFYHGTFQEFNPGDVVSSPEARGEGNPREGNRYYKPNRVYITPHYDLATGFASKYDAENHANLRGHVYEVEPIGRKQNDDEASSAYGAPKGTSFHVEQARVIRRVDRGEAVPRMRMDPTTGRYTLQPGQAD